VPWDGAVTREGRGGTASGFPLASQLTRGTSLNVRFRGSTWTGSREGAPRSEPDISLGPHITSNITPLTSQAGVAQELERERSEDEPSSCRAGGKAVGDRSRDSPREAREEDKLRSRRDRGQDKSREVVVRRRGLGADAGSVAKKKLGQRGKVSGEPLHEGVT